MHKILIIEDTYEINHMIRDLLQFNNMESVSAYTGSDGIMLLDKSFDLVILDLMLPDKPGAEVIEHIKQIVDIPVIVLTAMGSLDSKLQLFSLGANDYITKPFHGEELLARIHVHLKKNNNKKEETDILTYKDITLDTKNFAVYCNDQRVGMSKIEYSLLHILMKYPNQVFTKDNLFELVWNGENAADENTLNVHISKIRNKLKKANPNEEYIETVWAIGYKMK